MIDKTQIIASRLHALKCKWNHIDQCGWEYNTWDNPGYERKEYYKKAKKLVDKYGANKVLEMLEEHKILSDILK